MKSDYEIVLEMFNGVELRFEPIDARNYTPEQCKIYMRLVRFSWKTMYTGEKIPKNLEELEKWENQYDKKQQESE